MIRTYGEIFSEFPYKNPSGLSVAESSDTCDELALAALYAAIRNQFVNAKEILGNFQETCSSHENRMEIREAKLFIALDGKAIVNGQKALDLIENFLLEFPNAGFARVLQTEILIQKKNYIEAQTVVKEILGDFPEAKWLNIFLVQLEVFNKNYPQAALHAELMPLGILRSLNLLWTRFWYPRLFLNYILSILAVFSLSVLPNWILLIGFMAFFCTALFFLFGKKDRLTFLWFFYFGIGALLATIFP